MTVPKISPIEKLLPLLLFVLALLVEEIVEEGDGVVGESGREECGACACEGLARLGEMITRLAPVPLGPRRRAG